MLFDHHFRKMQARDNLQWDNMQAIWSTAFLYLVKTSRPFQPAATTHQQRKPAEMISGLGPRMRNKNGQIICLKFNNLAGCHRPHCTYSHVCATWLPESPSSTPAQQQRKIAGPWATHNLDQALYFTLWTFGTQKWRKIQIRISYWKTSNMDLG